MGTMTQAQRRALYESARFARETTYNGASTVEPWKRRSPRVPLGQHRMVFSV